METERQFARGMTKEQWLELEHGTPVKIFLTIFYSSILLLGIVGNTVTIKVTQVLLKKGYLQKNVTDHMVSLACSDLLVLIIGMPVELYSSTWFPFSSSSGNIACKIYSFLFEACSYATILNVATLSFERYIAICFPLKYQSLSGNRTVKLIVFAWVTSVLVALPLLFATGAQRPEEILGLKNHSFPGTNKVSAMNTSQNLSFCTNITSMWAAYRTSIFVAFTVYIVALVSVAFMCKSMIRVLTGTGKKNPKKQETRSSGFLPKHESPKTKESRKQTILFLGLIVGTLTGCWMPNQIRRLMTAAKPKADWTEAYLRGYITLHPVADTFFYLSSVLNPLLYNFSSKQFREVFVQVLRFRLTIEHVNKRNLRKPNVYAARKLLLRSLQRGLPSHGTDKAPNSPSGPQKSTIGFEPSEPNMNIEIDRQTGKETDRQVDRQTDKLIDKQTDRQIHRQTDRQIHGQTDGCLSYLKLHTSSV